LRRADEESSSAESVFTRTIEKLLLFNTVPRPARAFGQSATPV
jgi:hypothetical protein